METNNLSNHIHKLDKFAVKNSVRSEFLPIVLGIMELLKAQPGYIQSCIIEQPGETGEFNLVTLTEWESNHAFEGARGAVLAMQRESGLNTQELMARLGVRAEMGIYTAVNA